MCSHLNAEPFTPCLDDSAHDLSANHTIRCNAVCLPSMLTTKAKNVFLPACTIHPYLLDSSCIQPRKCRIPSRTQSWCTLPLGDPPRKRSNPTAPESQQRSCCPPQRSRSPRSSRSRSPSRTAVSTLTAALGRGSRLAASASKLMRKTRRRCRQWPLRSGATAQEGQLAKDALVTETMANLRQSEKDVTQTISYFGVCGRGTGNAVYWLFARMVRK
jgi:hypothetical protein